MKKKRIQKAHNNMFVKTFEDAENVRVFLNLALPEALKEAIDLSQISLEFTNYISDELKDGWSDLVVKTEIKTTGPVRQNADIYFLMEHKSYNDDKSLVQVLKYMYSEWQKDVDQGELLRVIIPLIFYHGEKKWTVPRTFAENFKVSEPLKQFLLNFTYVFFDTKDWDFMAAANKELKDNVFLLTSLVLMKHAFNNKWDIVTEIFKFWDEKGFTNDKEKATTCLTYITEIRQISMDNLKKVLNENKLAGGELVQNLAERLRSEGRKEGMELGKNKWAKQGANQKAKDIAKKMLHNNYSIESIVLCTGLSEQEVNALMS